MAEEVEVRHLEGLRADPGAGGPPRLSGTAVVFGTRSQNLGGWQEIVAPGTVSRDDLRALVALFNHDPARVLGRAPKTLTTELGDDGLRFDVTLPSHEAALAESVARGDIQGCSFAFRVRPGGDAWDDSTTPPTRTLKSIELREI